MPDTADVIDFMARLPNLALVSLAGNLPGHEVRVMDLVLFKPNVRKPLEDVLSSFRPDLVGLSSMTFQFDTLLRVAGFIRSRRPDIRIVAGGYHATLLSDELTAGEQPLPLDYIVRGEGEETFAELVSELGRANPDLGRIEGLSYRDSSGWVHNPDRGLTVLDRLALPDRSARVADGFSLIHLKMDVAETSRGCPFNCKFCCINRMYGPTFRAHSEERIIADIRDIRKRGAKAVFLVDDNITYDIDHFRMVCRSIVKNGLNDLAYVVQLSAAGIARNPDMAEEMDRANFRYAFVGFESMIPSALKGVHKPTNPEINRQAAALLRKHNIAIIAGCVVGYPDDTEESVKDNFRLIKKLKPDMIYAQYLTPYPKTVIRKELLEEGLVENIEDYRDYDGFHCNVRTRRMTRQKLYDTLKREALLSNFDPSLIFVNHFLRRFPLQFVSRMAKCAVLTACNVMAGRQRTQWLDL